MGKAQLVYDQLDILTFVQTTGDAVVDAFDASVDDISTSGVDTQVLNLEVASPNYLGQSVFVKPVADVGGDGIGGTGDPKIIATLIDGTTSSPATSRATATQLTADEVLEIPLPQGLKQYIKVNVKSNGGGASNAINAGAVMVYIGESSIRG